jgi:hypothetical protein
VLGIAAGAARAGRGGVKQVTARTFYSRLLDTAVGCSRPNFLRHNTAQRGCGLVRGCLAFVYAAAIDSPPPPPPPLPQPPAPLPSPPPLPPLPPLLLAFATSAARDVIVAAAAVAQCLALIQYTHESRRRHGDVNKAPTPFINLRRKQCTGNHHCVLARLCEPATRQRLCKYLERVRYAASSSSPTSTAAPHSFFTFSRSLPPTSRRRPPLPLSTTRAPREGTRGDASELEARTPSGWARQGGAIQRSQIPPPGRCTKCETKRDTAADYGVVNLLSYIPTSFSLSLGLRLSCRRRLSVIVLVGRRMRPTRLTPPPNTAPSRLAPSPRGPARLPSPPPSPTTARRVNKPLLAQPLANR